jgi:hypothetical protein
LVAHHDDYAPGVFIHLADASRAEGDWDRARELIAQAHEWAIKREEPGLAQVAMTLRAAIERKELHPLEIPETDSSTALLRSILARFGRWRSPGQGIG